MKNYSKVDEHNVAVRTMLERVNFSQKDVLEIGCGDGRISLQIAPHANFLTGFDLDRDEIQTAQSFAYNSQIENVKFLVGELSEIDLQSGSFDIVLFSLSLCCIGNDEPDPFLAKLDIVHRVWNLLKPGGVLINQLFCMRFHFNNLDSLIGYIVSEDLRDLTTYHGAESAYGSLKYATFIEGKFQFLSEDLYEIDWYLKGREGAINQFVGENDEFEKLPQEKKNQIEAIIAQFTDADGNLIEKGYDTLTIVQKI